MILSQIKDYLEFPFPNTWQRKHSPQKQEKMPVLRIEFFPTEIRFHKEISLDIPQETKSMGWVRSENFEAIGEQ